ncbi:conserved hypothetical protein [Methanohalobium evestigatum Z-7303]|uniref:Uncharacterized protein n=1 Tax=Methanohalobium evestigatum (strain ATCC BAA-1072 / DSM 3721 / NBRC 107634 / OCM 161 / Z-7303) TaxID=644295 RepID=D7E7M0_METEZ|nr:conserved hypothetical protein [Methanohalobium evestigatum Z-7303]
MSTTISIVPRTKEKLDSLRRFPQKSYNSIIERLIIMSVDEDELSDEAIQGIEEALEDIKKGRLYTHDELKREYGLM